MKTLISHETALRYWRQHFPLDGEPGKPASISLAESYSYKKQDILGCVPEVYREPDEPIDVLALSSERRHAVDGAACHVWSTFIPEGAFYQVGEMLISSPEFVFLQMAPALSVAQLAALGCELCGFYVLLKRDRQHPMALEDFPKRLSPLTNTDKLTAFVNSATGARGRAKALRALRFVVEASRSPMETLTYLLLCLPAMLGGYSLPHPAMNAEIPLDAEARKIAGRRSCQGDLCWIDERLDIEYYGDLHAGSTNMKDDVGRTLGIEHMGWKVITVTSPQVFDIDQFEVVAREAAGRLKKRLRPEILGYTPARQSLHFEMEEWMGELA